MELEQLSTFMLNQLRTELSPDFTYHSVEHTIDVVEAVQRISVEENTSRSDTNLLITAAWLHDIGFIYQSVEHEIKSCELAREILPNFDYSENEIEIICGMIMATRIPQTPQNKLEEIICDADLDYLGRNDFEKVGNNLYLELKTFGLIENIEQWNHLQVRFLEAHQFFTSYSKQYRNPVKMQNLNSVKNKLT